MNTTTPNCERTGIDLRGVYDGVSIWAEADGTYTNRWAGVPGLERRAAAAQAWIDAQGTATHAGTQGSAVASAA